MASAFTYKVPITPFMWEVFDLLYYAFFHGAVDYFSGLLPARSEPPAAAAALTGTLTCVRPLHGLLQRCCRPSTTLSRPSRPTLPPIHRACPSSSRC